MEFRAQQAEGLLLPNLPLRQAVVATSSKGESIRGALFLGSTHMGDRPSAELSLFGGQGRTTLNRP